MKDEESEGMRVALGEGGMIGRVQGRISERLTTQRMIQAHRWSRNLIIIVRNLIELEGLVCLGKGQQKFVLDLSEL